MVGNALKFTKVGEIVIHVTLIEEGEKGIQLMFKVRDTGVGIPDDKKDSLFDSFTQADASTTREYGGTGLGLSIAKKLAELMGGEIGVESELGKGSTFWFTVVFDTPVLKKHFTPMLPAEELQGRHIIFVDDNATNRLVFSKQLEAWGCKYEEASGGEEFLQKVRQAVNEGDPFEAAFVDMQMPKMDGATLGKQVKADEKLRDLPLIMVSSIGERGDAARFETIGFAAFLAKPVKQSTLYNCLLSVLGMSKMVAGGKSGKIITRHTLAESKRHGIRILIVEDNPVNQMLALKMLEKLGCWVKAVNNGAEALSELEQNRYDLVFMDCQMPVLNGYETTREIRASTGKYKDIPIVAMTANAMKGDREKCLEAGMNDYITKPINLKMITELINKMV